MRLDPGSLGTVATICVIAVVTTLAWGMFSSATLGAAILVIGAASSVALFARQLHRTTSGLGNEKLATELSEELRAALEAPPVAPTPAALEEGRRALGGCPRCGQHLGEPGGDWQQRDCVGGCGTLVLDSERLLVERASLDLDVVRGLVREQGVVKGVCPACSSAMHEGRLRGLQVNLCLSCGALWLDTGELAILTRAAAFRGA